MIRVVSIATLFEILVMYQILESESEPSVEEPEALRGSRGTFPKAAEASPSAHPQRVDPHKSSSSAGVIK
ncbi:hypothetical protein PM082_023929 [Marasmius tenuissimus]|nr:hypothetical protein PM082_023929 [Marasmius tenuissimus]